MFQEIYTDSAFHNFESVSGESTPLRLKLDAMSRRVRDGVLDAKQTVHDSFAGVAQKVETFAENVMKISALGALASATVYLGKELLTQPTHTSEALFVFATALSLALAAREQLREPDTSSLRAWRLRDRN